MGTYGVWPAVGSIALLLVLFAGSQRLVWSGPRPFYRGRVTGVVGRMGSGKTLFITRILLLRLKAGGHVAANFTFSVPGYESKIHRVRGWADIVALPPNTLCVVDEAHLWAPGTSGKTIPAEVRWLLSHLRKLGVEFWWVTQHEDRVSAALRAQTHEMILCKKGARHHTAEWYTPEALRLSNKDDRGKPLWRFRYRASKKLISTYETMEMIRPDEMAEGAEVISLWLAKRDEVIAARAAGEHPRADAASA